MNLEIFDENFMIFWISRTIKINLEKMEQIEWINQGLRFYHKLLWVQLRDKAYLGAIWRQERGQV
jgi:hypothetical protein